MSLSVSVLEDVVETIESHGFELVGHGSVTSGKCGTFRSFWGCVRVELHDKVSLDGVNHKGKVYVRAVFDSCDKASCPICSKYGWAVREAGKIEGRLKVASKRFGLVEHIVVSVPPRFYDLGYEALRGKVVDALRVRGVVGGALIFHGGRYNRLHRWYWSPHFHVLGFVLGGYGCCRGCKKRACAGFASKEVCVGCGGFEARTRRENVKDGCIVKIAVDREGRTRERITVGGTAWYQLNHATVRKGVERFHVVTWFGVCSYRKLKVTAEVRHEVCPICQHDLERLRYVGGNPEVLSVFSLRRGGGKLKMHLSFEVDAFEGGKPAWFVEVREGYRDNG